MHEQQFIELIRSGHAHGSGEKENASHQNSAIPQAFSYAQKYFSERINTTAQVPPQSPSVGPHDAPNGGANGAAANGVVDAGDDQKANTSLERVKELFMCLLVYDMKTGKCLSEKHEVR